MFGRFSKRTFQKHCQNFSRIRNFVARPSLNIQDETELTNSGLTPEIRLHLITPRCRLWHEKQDGELPFPDPFWGFYWPGGQGVARYILNNPFLVHDKRVLDVGAGSGACALAAKLAGANNVCANDICLDAVAAVELNQKANLLEVSTFHHNLLGSSKLNYDVVLFGDMLYDEALAEVITQWCKLLILEGKTIILGCPGRRKFPYNLSRLVRPVAKYRLCDEGRRENHGLTETVVWTSPQFAIHTGR